MSNDTKTRVLNGGTTLVPLERRDKQDSMLHRRAEMFERGTVRSFLIVSVSDEGVVQVDFDALAAGGTQMDLGAEYGRLAAGAIQAHDRLLGEIVKAGGQVAQMESGEC